MNIAIDISPLSSGHRIRGVGSYVSLLKENIQKYDKNNRYIFFTGELPENADLVHYPYFDPFFPTLPSRKKIKTIVTVHDLIPIMFKKHFPAGFKGGLRWQYNKILLKKQNRIIVNSEATKKDLVKIVGVDRDKIDTVYLAVDPIYKKINLSKSERDKLSSKYNLPDKFMVYVGDVTWNKNLPRIIEAVKKTEINLLLIGKAIADDNFDRVNPWNKDRTRVGEMIHGVSRIKALGFLPDDDLSKIYNMADALLMPSLYEGFGLPILEAMSTGCPVITSREGSIEEVGGDAVLYVDAYSVDSIHEGILRFNTDDDLKQSFSEKGLVRAEKFNLERFITGTISSYIKNE